MSEFELISLKELSERPRPKNQWAVTDEGMECVQFEYFIESSRLHQTSIILHMADKEWVNMRDFILCFFAARHRHFPTVYPSKQGIYNGDNDKGKTRKERRLTHSIRFRILHRDGFHCQLCGATAKDGAVLEVDHKKSVSDGGSDIENNLWTLCFDCNRGKGALSLP